YLYGDQAVGGQTKVPSREAETAPEGYAGDPDRWAGPGRQCYPSLGEASIDVDQLRARPDRRCSERLVDADRVQLAQIEHHPVRQRRVPRVAVSARAGP